MVPHDAMHGFDERILKFHIESYSSINLHYDPVLHTLNKQFSIRKTEKKKKTPTKKKKNNRNQN
jgi:hypothetical protein